MLNDAQPDLVFDRGSQDTAERQDSDNTASQDAECCRDVPVVADDTQHDGGQSTGAYAEGVEESVGPRLAV